MSAAQGCRFEMLEIGMKQKLLFLCQTLPYPPDSGVGIRSYNTLRLLARDYDVVMLCFYRVRNRSSKMAVEAALRGMAPLAHVEAFAIPQEHSRLRLVGDHLRSMLQRLPYTQFAYESPRYRERIEYWLSTENFAVVHVDSLDLVGYLPLLLDRRVVCVHHNVESALLLRRSQAERNPLRQWYLKHQAQLVENTERRWCGRVDLNVAVSHGDRQALERIAPDADYIVVPNGVDTDYFRPVNSEKSGVVYVGGVNWFPNRDALEYFCAAILPQLRRSGFASSVRWLGRAPDKMKREYAREHAVELAGYVPDIRSAVQQSACYIVPLRVGGGTRLKILDAWAMGKAVVSTSIGCEGLEAVDGENILIRDDPTHFADAVREVLCNARLREQLEIGARATAVRSYSWEVVGDAMKHAYQNLHDVGVTRSGHAQPSHLRHETTHRSKNHAQDAVSQVEE